MMARHVEQGYYSMVQIPQAWNLPCGQYLNRTKPLLKKQTKTKPVEMRIRKCCVPFPPVNSPQSSQAFWVVAEQEGVHYKKEGGGGGSKKIPWSLPSIIYSTVSKWTMRTYDSISQLTLEDMQWALLTGNASLSSCSSLQPSFRSGLRPTWSLLRQGVKYEIKPRV